MTNLFRSRTSISLICYSKPYEEVVCSESFPDLMKDLYEHYSGRGYKPEVFEVYIDTFGDAKVERMSKKELRELLSLSEVIPDFMKEDIEDILGL